MLNSLRIYLIEWPITNPLKRLQKAGEHQPRRRAHIVTEFKLPKILGKMLLGDMNMSTFDASFNLAPKSFSGINVVDSVDVLFMSMIANPMLKTFRGERVISRKLIGLNQTPFFDMLFHNWKECFPFNIWNHVSHNVTTTLNHSKHNSFCWNTPTMIFRILSTNISFIGFNLARKFVIPINLCHVLADFVSHSPS